MSQYLIGASENPSAYVFNFGKCNWEQYQAKMKEVNEFKEKMPVEETEEDTQQ